MPQEQIHLIKLCVGAASVDDLVEWRIRSLSRRKQAGLSHHTYHTTRMWPRREAELVAGGSLFWVIRGLISVRQPIAGFEEVIAGDGIRRCNILLEPEYVLTELRPKRPFQGWRYLKSQDAPDDLPAGRAGLPREIAGKLADLGLL